MLISNPGSFESFESILKIIEYNQIIMRQIIKRKKITRFLKKFIQVHSLQNLPGVKSNLSYEKLNSKGSKNLQEEKTYFF